jgi:cytochrome c553
MKRAGSAVLVFAIVAGGAASSSFAQQTQVERGKYLVDTGGCHDCHSPKKMGGPGLSLDTSRLLSGAPADAKLPPPPKLGEGPWAAVATWDLTAWSGPWGISYAANLTPDQETGLVGWTEPIFVSTMRTGKHMGSGRPILPPMPWETIGKLTDEDLKAICAYLKTVKPIKNRVPSPVPPSK